MHITQHPSFPDIPTRKDERKSPHSLTYSIHSWPPEGAPLNMRSSVGLENDEIYRYTLVLGSPKKILQFLTLL
jgi:hypothetical protein